MNAPMMIRVAIAGMNGDATSSSERARTSVNENVPSAAPMNRMPAKSANPPPPVTSNDCNAALRA